MALQTTSTMSANLYYYYVKNLLSVAEPRMVLHPLGKAVPLPKGMGTQVKWLRYARINGSTTPLGEGVTPSETDPSTGNVTASVAQYGQFSKVSDLLSMTAIDPVIESLSTRFGIAAACTIEDLIVAELDSAAYVQRVAGRATDDLIQTGDLLNHKELIKAMINQKIAFLEAHESGNYVVVLHPACEFDILSDTQAGGFVDISKYTAPGRPALMNGEIGKLYGMKVLVSDRMTSIAGALTTVRRNYVIAEEAFGVVSLNGSAVKIIVKPHGSAGANDPLDQFATVGYKLNGFVAKFLQASSKRVIQLRSASTL